MKDEYAETLVELEAALQVRHIAHRPLVTIARDAKPAAAERLASGKTLNNLPVRGADGAIVGVLENINGGKLAVERPRLDVSAVSHSMRTLDDRIVVESRQTIERLLQDLLSPPYYQLVVTDGRIDGIVTVSDLNKAPVRVLAYATMARLETAMSVAIRTVTRNSDEAAIQALVRAERARYGAIIASCASSISMSRSWTRQRSGRKASSWPNSACLPTVTTRQSKRSSMACTSGSGIR
ncbi:CBS domain-containing protein [Solirubrobacter phytolaccae]|uniref:CBS domain-containing protein n=1 Tax=Solirubrobacter phytolaccae TaxID=1404360 RepID=A0A9X3SDT3_9ACTN|nr:CBS domain-containing protein [Solirubrobacter phytolaccae]MDA0184055.1 CBS domain-containing protein [Solirubrobacter phytolaccae]